MTEVAIRRTQINLVITVPRPAAKHPVILHFTIPIFAPLPHVPAKGKGSVRNGAKIRSFWDKPLGVFTLKTGLNLAPFGSVRACVQKQDDTSPVPAFSRYPHPDSSVVPLVSKVSAALWERTWEAKLRFGGGRVRMGERLRSSCAEGETESLSDERSQSAALTLGTREKLAAWTAVANVLLNLNETISN